MNPFEDLIHSLGNEMGVTLNPDHHQSCLILFHEQNVHIQIDLDTNADQILIGTEIGQLLPGPYREKMLSQALLVNGIANEPRGFLAFSEKNDSLVLFQFLPLAFLTGEELYRFLQVFVDHARIWKEALNQGNIPQIEENSEGNGHKMFGLRR